MAYLSRLIGPQLLAQRGVGLALQLGLMALIGHAAGAAGIGAYAVFVAWQGTAASLAAGGVSTWTLRATAEAAAGQEREKSGVHQLLAIRLLPLRALSGAGGCAVLALALGSVGVQLIVGVGPWVFAAAVTASTGASIVVDVACQAIKGQGRPVLGSIISQTTRPALLLILLASVVESNGTITTTLIVVGHAVLSVGLAILLYGYLLRRAVVERAVAAQEPVYSGVGALWGIQVVGMLGGYLPVLMMPFFLSPHDVGLVAVGLQLARIPGIGLDALAAAYGPGFAVAYSRHDWPGIFRLLGQTSVWGTVFTLPLLIAALVAPVAVYQLLGNGLEAARWPLVALLSGRLIDAATGLVGPALVMVHAERAELVAQFVGLAIVILVSPGAAHVGGALAFAGAVGLSFAVRNVVGLVAFLRCAHVNRAPAQIRPVRGEILP